MYLKHWDGEIALTGRAANRIIHLCLPAGQDFYENWASVPGHQ